LPVRPHPLKPIALICPGKRKFGLDQGPQVQAVRMLAIEDLPLKVGRQKGDAAELTLMLKFRRPRARKLLRI